MDRCYGSSIKFSDRMSQSSVRFSVQENEKRGGSGEWKKTKRKKEKTEEETYKIKAALYRRCLECSASNLDRRLKVLREMQPEERHVSIRNARPDRYSFLVLTKDLDNLRKSR